MKILMVAMVAVMMMATVGTYAASMTGTVKTVGGTGSVSVGAPAASVSVAWNLNASGQVSGASVTWTPGSNANYTIQVSAGSSSCSVSVTNAGTTSRTDSCTLGAAQAADAVTSATTVIKQD